MSSEDTEWELLEKRINDAKKPDPVAPTLRRATIKMKLSKVSFGKTNDFLLV